MSLKIEWTREEELITTGFCPKDIPVVRLDELRRWLQEHERKPLLMPLNKQARDQNAILIALLAELKEVKP